jgi:hypothetical protein
VVLGHIISKKDLEVDKAKIEVIEKLPPPTSVKEIHSFLGHAWFYRRFIKDFSKIVELLTNLIMKDVDFNFDEHYFETFCRLKKALVSAPILQPPEYFTSRELDFSARNISSSRARNISQTRLDSARIFVSRV